jgi:hypothetical protein
MRLWGVRLTSRAWALTLIGELVTELRAETATSGARTRRELLALLEEHTRTIWGERDPSRWR